MTAVPVAWGWTGNGDGAGSGLSFTTPAGVTGSQRLLAGVGCSANGDTLGVPAVGTWQEVLLPDNVVTTSGGQFRLYECVDPASSTAYAFTMASTRRTIGWVLVDGADDTGVSIVDVASSLESGPAATHAPPSAVPNAANELVFDWLWFRQFNPDISTCSPPATGLSWTEILDVHGADAGGSGQNIQLAVNYATAGAAGAAISTAALNTDDPFEPALVMRVVITSAAGGPAPVNAAGRSRAAVGHTAASAKHASGSSTSAAAAAAAATAAKHASGSSTSMAAAAAAAAAAKATPVAGSSAVVHVGSVSRTLQVSGSGRSRVAIAHAGAAARASAAAGVSAAAVGGSSTAGKHTAAAAANRTAVVAAAAAVKAAQAAAAAVVVAASAPGAPIRKHAAGVGVGRVAARAAHRTAPRVNATGRSRVAARAYRRRFAPGRLTGSAASSSLLSATTAAASTLTAAAASAAALTATTSP